MDAIALTVRPGRGRAAERPLQRRSLDDSRRSKSTRPGSPMPATRCTYSASAGVGAVVTASMLPDVGASVSARATCRPEPLAMPACAVLANGRCAAIGWPRLAFTSAWVARAWCRGWSCPRAMALGGASRSPPAAALSARQKRERFTNSVRGFFGDFSDGWAEQQAKSL